MIVDKMAQRYCKLPSEILSTATTLDFKIMDMAESYIRYQRTIEETGRPPAPKLSVDQMKDLIKRAKALNK